MFKCLFLLALSVADCMCSALSQVFDLPGSVLHSIPHSATDHGGSYKEAVDGFIRCQQHEKMAGDSASFLEDQLARLNVHGSLQQEGPPVPGTRPPPVPRTEELTKLFGAVKTLTAKEELLQTLR